MKYIICIWCPACVNEDYCGCFDGESVYLKEWIDEQYEETYLKCDASQFLTHEIATIVAEEYIEDSIWKYEIVEV